MDSNSNCSSCAIVFEPDARRLSVNRRPLNLTTAEYEILACLIHHKGKVVSRETLTAAVFGREFNPLDRAVDVHISHLRKKLGTCRALIITVRSAGYLLPSILIASLLMLISAPAANAQTEDTEPRAVGGAGVMSIGLSGFIDKYMSPENTFPWNVTLHVDVTRFISERFAVRGGVIGSTSIGGEDDDAVQTGPGVNALHAHGGMAFYFTPRSMASLYAGGEYRAQITDRAEPDAGTVLAKGGVQAAISSRVGVFVEGGYGFRLTRGDDDERQTRIVGELGFRIRF